MRWGANFAIGRQNLYNGGYKEFFSVVDNLSTTEVSEKGGRLIVLLASAK